MLLTERRKIKRGEDLLSQCDPQMAKLIERFGRCKLRPWQSDPFSSLITSIISQQLSVKAASTICQRFFQVAGSPPLSATRLLEIPHQELRACGLSNAKSSYCLGIAEGAESGRVNFSGLHQFEPEQIVAQLTELKGIGQWTAEMFLIFGLGYQDIWSYGDLGLKKGVMILQGLDEFPSEQVFISAGEKWRPYRSIASWYLWRLVESA